MPELPEVERATNHVKSHAQNKTITRIETNEDSIVFSGTTHIEFASAVQSRTVKDVKRYGKVFYLELDGEGPMPVLHFGMTGNVIVKGEEPLYYKEGPRSVNTQWPPRFTKFILHLSRPEDKVTPSSNTQIAFVDPRRLGRIRLCNEPTKEPPISLLGFDPILSMPPLEDFSKKILKRSCPVKALLLDQTFSAGVGNWVADEILYHSRIHPEQKCHTLTRAQVSALHKNTSYVCKTAVSVNADHKKFPGDWLFIHRWGKGKRQSSNPLKLPSGEPATIKWLTVGGRTSAFVTELQSTHVLKESDAEAVQEAGEDSSLTSLSGSEGNARSTRSKTRKLSQEQMEPTSRKRQRNNL